MELLWQSGGHGSFWVEREREEMSILLHGEKVNGASFLVKKTFGFIWAIQMLHSRYAVV
jgi:hypothetical protein